MKNNNNNTFEAIVALIVFVAIGVGLFFLIDWMNTPKEELMFKREMKPIGTKVLRKVVLNLWEIFMSWEKIECIICQKK